MINYNFTGNFSPANSKDFTPIYKIDYTDTPFTVKSSGIRLRRYLINSSNTGVFAGTANPDLINFTGLTAIDDLITNIVGFYAEDGAMMGFHYSDNFAMKYTGYFYTDHPGTTAKTYEFKAYGFGRIRIQIGSTYIIGANSGVYNDDFKPLDENTWLSSSINLLPRSWYAFTVDYYSLLGESGFTLLWKNKYHNQFIPVSAGVVSQEQSFKTSTTLDDVLTADRNYSKGDVHTFSFSVPLVVSGSTAEGYYYNSFWDRYCHSTSDIALDKFKMIEFYSGYKVNGVDNYIKKYVGHIETFRPKREKKGDSIEIECVGFENLYKQTLNLNYPNTYDYWNVEYTGNKQSEYSPDGVNKPPTFDGWELDKVFKILSIRAGIDPTLFLKKKLLLNYNNVIISGNNLIETTSPSRVVLDRNINYGNSKTANKDIGAVPDDEYINKSNFGDQIFDYINTITDVYGWQWGCNAYYDGAPYLQSNNNPYTYYTVNDITNNDPNGYGYESYGTFLNASDAKDLNTLSGKYAETNTAGSWGQFIIKGSKANLVIVGRRDGGTETSITGHTAPLNSLYVASTSGFAVDNRIIFETLDGEESGIIDTISGNEIALTDDISGVPRRGGYVRIATFKVEIKQGTVWSSNPILQTSYHSCYFYNDYTKYITDTGYKNTYNNPGTKRYYYDGIDPTTSVNPTIITVMKNFAYDDYVIRCTRLANNEAGTTNVMSLDAILVFDRDTNKIVRTYYTGDSVVSGTVIEMTIEDSAVDLRNDTIVVGRRLGVDTPGDKIESPINPNNPSYRHIVSRATDVASIYNPNARNYTGMPRQTIQIAPEVASEDRAKYWSISFINRYRYPRKVPTDFSVMGDPLMELDDCISVSDEGRDILGTYDKFWVTDIKETYERKKYISNFSTSPYEPWESYTPRINPNPAYFGNIPISNFSMENNGTELSPYDPYSADAFGTLVKIKYDLVIPAWVRIDIYSYKRPDIRVTTLLNPTGSEGPEGWQKQDPAKNYIVTWDGVDLDGKWNDYCTQNATEKIGSKYYVCEGTSDDSTFGKFFVKFTLINRNTSLATVLFSNSTVIDITGDFGYIYTQRDMVSVLQLSINPTNKFRKLSGDSIKARNDMRASFTDSIRDQDGNPACCAIYLRDKTCDLSSSRLQIANTNYFYATNIINRRVQLQVKIHNVVIVRYLQAAWDRIRYVITEKIISLPIFEDVYYNNEAFIYYNDYQLYINPKLNGYEYNFQHILSETDRNNIQFSSGKIDGGGKVWMGWYMYIEIAARDKSGRRCTIWAPSPYWSTEEIVAEGAWILWIDDTYPYPKPITLPFVDLSAFDPRNNISGYNITLADIGKLTGETDTRNVILLNSDGTDIIRHNTYGIADKEVAETYTKYKLAVFQVYPKVDAYGEAWGDPVTL